MEPSRSDAHLTTHSWSSREQRLDVQFGLALLALGVFEYVVFRDVYYEESLLNANRPNAWLLVLTVVGIVPVMVRRRFPIPALVVSHLAWMATISAALAPTSTGQLTVFILFYSVALHAPKRSTDLARATVLGVVLGWMILGVVQDSVPWGLVPIVAMIYAITWTLGNTARNRQDTQSLLQERAERLERERTMEATRAVEAERARIATELHDVVAHSLTVMTVQAAGAKRILASSPTEASAALETIETTGREAMAEMRRIVRVMRDDTGARQPQPGLADLPALVDQIRDTGLAVDLAVDVDCHLSPGIDLTAYRIVQEALTNAIKHGGPGAVARVGVTHTDGILQIHVGDDGRGAAADAIDGGQGLIGMHERVSAYNGTVEAGPVPGGGFDVLVRIPTESTT